MTSADGATLLTTEAAAPLLAAVANDLGSVAQSWRLDHVDADPGRSTTATYRVDLVRDNRSFRHTIGCTIRANGPSSTDQKARILSAGPHQVACWIYPDDPDLPGLRRAVNPVSMAELLQQAGLGRIDPTDLTIDLIGYRPRRRAVLRVRLNREGLTLYVKAFRRSQFEAVCHRHQILADSAVPSPQLVVATDDRLMVLAETQGTPLARAVFAPVPPVTGQQMVDVLDAMPLQVASLERRPPWASSVRHYSGIVSAAMPELRSRLSWLADQIEDGLAGVPVGDEATHGDFYEAQVFVQGGRVSGLIDIDTIGPGRRADDLACLVAHLNCIQRMNAAQTRQIARLLAAWTPAFDRRVDPIELRLRAAAVVISLATGPYRSQERHWQRETERMVAKAEALVDQVRPAVLPRRALV
ncbi:MAG: aminoglycoside phosphotransferase family protein [Propionibacteriaceae bacterium]|jgi:Ser/Thr protein kinase RdoA (MazF antagonist)|nr:aminoglycoside phosphotransferase family protein [Propionibacteriaceae bacterium]